MPQGLATISHGYYQPYFYWMFPIVVAKEEGLFEKEGVSLRVHDIVPGGQPENKAKWYKDALDDGSRNFYFCCAWQGIYSTCETGKGKIGAAIRSTLIKTFGVYTRPESRIKSVLDITNEGLPIAVNKNADAHYVTLQNLKEFVPASKVKFKHLGGIDTCFRALASGEVQAATLAGPYAEAAEALGYRRVMALSRTEPTLIVFDDAVDAASANSFLAAVNKAVDRINAERAKYHRRYLREFEEVVNRYIPELKDDLAKVKQRVSLPVWAESKVFSREEFDGIHGFLLEHSLSARGKGYEGAVKTNLAIAH
ncbi:MAG: ABC transporter substrate-binding protein [Nitrososphaerota archaeon]|nr:ABC transporter substrate-binding protein [Nitrososphaerota archaeon]MDG7005467.1 ABC transporter substrate-binding protein [Nitrososphaerota archaeon]MDG7021344.1 ABC transporter substrate-binding protein [Nitrososphaerota archaeon]